MFMDQEDVCDTGLALRLGYGGTAPYTDRHRQRDRGSPLSNPTPFEPSLTLSLSDGLYVPAKPKVESNKEGEERRPGRLSSPHSALSSFSTAYPASVKRERDTAAEEAEAERVSSRVDDDDDDEGGARKKLRLTKEQSAFLEERFKEQSTLNPKQKQALARQLNLRPRQVEVWFQNRRARTKLKQTEVDCEFLKRCCETLTADNRRLQKELQELRGLKFAPPTSLPLYMQLPAATLTMCPSCERIYGGGDGSHGGGAGPFAVPPKPHFFNPFAHPAAC